MAEIESSSYSEILINKIRNDGNRESPLNKDHRKKSFREDHQKILKLMSKSMIRNIIFFFFWSFFAFSRAAPAAYADSQTRGQIGAVATGLRQSHSNAGSELRLQPTLQLTTTPDP